MNKFNFILVFVIYLSLFVSCNQDRQAISNNGRVIIDKSIMETDSSSEEEEIDWVKISRENPWSSAFQVKEVKETPTTRRDLYFEENFQKLIDSEIKDLSSYETHPFEKYLGKWILMDNNGNINSNQENIEIFYENFQYRFNWNYYHSYKGRLFLTDGGIAQMLPDEMDNVRLPLYKIIELVTSHYGEPMIYMFTEGLDEYVLVSEKDINHSVRHEWGIENLTGTWVSGNRQIPAATVDFDILQETVKFRWHGLFIIKEISKNIEGHIIINMFSADDLNKEDPVNFQIVPLDAKKAFIFHDKWEVWEDNRYSMEEECDWYKL